MTSSSALQRLARIDSRHRCKSRPPFQLTITIARFVTGITVNPGAGGSLFRGGPQPSDEQPHSLRGAYGELAKPIPVQVALTDLEDLVAAHPLLEVIHPGVRLRVYPSQVVPLAAFLLQPLQQAPLQQVRALGLHALVARGS